MHDEPLNEAAVLVWAHEVERAEGQDNEVHKEEDGDSVEHATDDEVISQEFEFATRQAVDCSAREGDEVVEEDPKDPWSEAVAGGLATE